MCDTDCPPVFRPCIQESVGGYVGTFIQRNSDGTVVDITGWVLTCAFSIELEGGGTTIPLTVGNGGLVRDDVNGTVSVYIPAAVAEALSMGTTYYGDLKIAPNDSVPFVAFQFEFLAGAAWS